MLWWQHQGKTMLWTKDNILQTIHHNSLATTSNRRHPEANIQPHNLIIRWLSDVLEFF